MMGNVGKAVTQASYPASSQYRPRTRDKHRRGMVDPFYCSILQLPRATAVNEEVSELGLRPGSLAETKMALGCTQAGTV